MTPLQDDWNTLLSSALIGTERAEAAPVRGELEPYARRLEGRDRESKLLGTAALLAQVRRAGSIPPALEPADLSPAPPETRPAVSPLSGWHLEQCLSGKRREVLPEWLEACARAGKRAPERLLPALLDAGRGSVALRNALEPVLGERGVWLARLNPQWSYLEPVQTGDDEALWLEGNLSTRREVLVRMRERDPQRALRLLEEGWKGEAGEAREAFVPLLEVNLSLDDEALLEVALEDRRGAVRSSAAGLLMHLPGSAYAARMRARGVSALAWRCKVLEVTPPGECDRAMVRDGIEKKPSHGQGERSWWLEQTLSRIPLDFWEAHLGRTPAQILEALRGSPFEDEVLLACAGSLRGFSGPLHWAKALLEHLERHRKGRITHSPNPSWNYHVVVFSEENYLGLLPAPEHEGYVLGRLERYKDALEAEDSPVHLLGRVPRPWGVPLGRLLLERLHTYLKRQALRGPSQGYDSRDYRLRHALNDALLKLDPHSGLEHLYGWPEEDRLTYAFQGALREARATLEFRRELHEELKR